MVRKTATFGVAVFLTLYIFVQSSRRRDFSAVLKGANDGVGGYSE